MYIAKKYFSKAKDFIFYNYISKNCIYPGRYLTKLQKIKIYKEAKTTYENFFSSNFLMNKILYFISISVNYISLH